jgi:hypothetical protein
LRLEAIGRSGKPGLETRQFGPLRRRQALIR